MQSHGFGLEYWSPGHVGSFRSLESMLKTSHMLKCLFFYGTWVTALSVAKPLWSVKGRKHNGASRPSGFHRLGFYLV